MATIVENGLTQEKIDYLRKKIEAQKSMISKKYLDSLFLPSEILGRENQAEQLVKHLCSIQEGFVAPFISVYGRSGSGKSTVVKKVCDCFSDITCTRFVNLRRSSTVFGSANLILSELGLEQLKNSGGLDRAVDLIENRIAEILLEENKKFFVLVLDEYDVIFSDKRGRPADFVYKLLAVIENLREKGMWLSVITISNNTLADYKLDDRIKSRTGNTAVFFEPYTEYEIYQILFDRAQKAACGIDESVLRYIAKLASDDHGDARRAVDLLRVASELSDGSITKKNVDDAGENIQDDKITRILLSASPHFRRAFVALARFSYLTGRQPRTSEIYCQYRFLLPKNAVPIKPRRFNDILQELSQSGLAYSEVNFNGRGGMNAKFALTVPAEYLKFLSPKGWDNIVELKKKRYEYLNNPKYRAHDYMSQIARFEDEKRWRKLVGLDYLF